MEQSNDNSMPLFKDLVYERPDIEAFRKTVRDIRLKLMTATDPDFAADTLFEYEQEISRIDTAYALCNIRHDLNTQDEFFVKELEFFDEALATVSELQAAVLSILLTCPCKDTLRERFGDMIFRKAQNHKDTVSSEILDELVEESTLENEYSQLQSEAEIEFGKQTLNLSLLTPYLESSDRQVRAKASYALDNYYMSRKDDFDRIYDNMVRVRTEAARKLGYKNFTELGYKRMERYDYGREDIERFRENILKYFVPLSVQIRKNQQERFGYDKLMFYDLPALFRDGNPVPSVKGKDYDKAAGEFFRKMFGHDPSFFDVLSEHGFTDLLSRPAKSTGGYCVYLEDNAIPYIFMNGNGTADDVATIIHEGGHAYAAIRSADSSPFVECQSPTLETCEIHSTAMEYMSYPYMDIFYKDNADLYRQLHMTQGILFLPYGCMVDEFQHLVYDNPDMGIDDRHKAWRYLEEKYQPFINYDDKLPFHKIGGAWQKKDHIFTTPFYYIDYCLSQICALELWQESTLDMKSALHKYNELCVAGGNDTFLNLIKNAGIDSPFETDTIKKIAYSCSKFLEL